MLVSTQTDDSYTSAMPGFKTHACQSLVQSISTLAVQSGPFHSTDHNTLLLKFIAQSHSGVRTKLSGDTPVPECSESPCSTFVTAAEFCHSKIKKWED